MYYMRKYDGEGRELYQMCKELVDECTSDPKHKSENNAKIALSWFNGFKDLAERAIDCAHKLAPYSAPKLNAIEVKQKIQHQFVIRTPKPIQSVEEWQAATGVEKLNENYKENTIRSLAKPVPTILDYTDVDAEDLEDDEIKTQRFLQ